MGLEPAIEKTNSFFDSENFTLIVLHLVSENVESFIGIIVSVSPTTIISFLVVSIRKQ